MTPLLAGREAGQHRPACVLFRLWRRRGWGVAFGERVWALRGVGERWEQEGVHVGALSAWGPWCGVPEISLRQHLGCRELPGGDPGKEGTGAGGCEGEAG